MSATFKSLSELLEKVEARKKLGNHRLNRQLPKNPKPSRTKISRSRDDKMPQEAGTIQKLKKSMKGSLLKKANIKLTNNKRVRVQQVGCGREEKFCK